MKLKFISFSPPFSFMHCAKGGMRDSSTRLVIVDFSTHG